MYAPRKFIIAGPIFIFSRDVLFFPGDLDVRVYVQRAGGAEVKVQRDMDQIRAYNTLNADPTVRWRGWFAGFVWIRCMQGDVDLRVLDTSAARDWSADRGVMSLSAC